MLSGSTRRRGTTQREQQRTSPHCTPLRAFTRSSRVTWIATQRLTTSKMAEEGPAPQHDPQDLVNTLFPPPPAFYQQFTTANLTRYASLAGPSGTSKNRALPTSTPEHVANGERSSEEEEEYQTLRSTLEPPRADWVEEDGRWKCFGEVYTVYPLLDMLRESL